MNLQNMKISTRLMLGFAAMGALIALLGAVALTRITNIGAEFDVVQQDRFPKIVLVNEIKGEVNDVARAVRNFFIMTDAADLKSQFDEVASSDAKITAAFEQLQKSVTSEQGKAQLAEVLTARAAYRAPRDRVVDLARAGKLEEARPVLLKEMRPTQLVFMEKLDGFIKLQTDLMTASGDAVDASVHSSRTIVVGLIVTAFALGALLAFLIIRSTTRPLNEAVRVARAVSEGDLAIEFDANGTNETGLLLGALHAMKTRLASIVGGVRENAEGVATASAQIAQGNSDLSSRTEEQASALEETAASMEELASTVKQNADNARQANQLALGASTVAVKGGDVVGQVVETMKGINDSSKRIADIIGVIDGIAFQTNILALNAAVEAARAGEQGRGFAVVAGEVRNLAQRSAEAAKEIKSLISTSVERVEQGTLLVDRAGTTMTEVVTAIRRVTDIMGEISAASTEQSAGVAQVGEAVSQMDQATQQNAALVEESAAAAESLKVQAQHLVQAVAVFKLAHGAGAIAAPASSTVAPVWHGQERRGPTRATNVTRLPAKPVKPVKPAAAVRAEPPKATASAARPASPRSTGTDDWESF